MSKLLTLEDRFSHGKHEGKQVKWVLNNDSQYLKFLYEKKNYYYSDYISKLLNIPIKK